MSYAEEPRVVKYFDALGREIEKDAILPDLSNVCSVIIEQKMTREEYDRLFFYLGEQQS